MESLELQIAKAVSHFGSIITKRNITKQMIKMYSTAPDSRMLGALLDHAPYARQELDQNGQQARRGSSPTWIVDKAELSAYVSKLEQELARDDAVQQIDISTLAPVTIKLLDYLITNKLSVTSSGTYTQRELCSEELTLNLSELSRGLSALVGLGLVTKTTSLRRRKKGALAYVYSVNMDLINRQGICEQVRMYSKRK